MVNMNIMNKLFQKIFPPYGELYHMARQISLELSIISNNQKNEFEWIKSHEFVTKLDLKEMEKHIMSQISDFANRQNAFNDRIDAAITGVSGDVKELTDLVAKLQSTPGAITPEDQALLDQIDARASALATKVEALDALTPPVVPPVA